MFSSGCGSNSENTGYSVASWSIVCCQMVGLASETPLLTIVEHWIRDSLCFGNFPETADPTFTPSSHCDWSAVWSLGTSQTLKLELISSAPLSFVMRLYRAEQLLTTLLMWLDEYPYINTRDGQLFNRTRFSHIVNSTSNKLILTDHNLTQANLPSNQTPMYFRLFGDEGKIVFPNPKLKTLSDLFSQTSGSSLESTRRRYMDL